MQRKRFLPIPAIGSLIRRPMIRHDLSFLRSIERSERLYPQLVSSVGYERAVLHNIVVPKLFICLLSL